MNGSQMACRAGDGQCQRVDCVGNWSSCGRDCTTSYSVAIAPLEEGSACHPGRGYAAIQTAGTHHTIACGAGDGSCLGGYYWSFSAISLYTVAIVAICACGCTGLWRGCRWRNQQRSIGIDGDAEEAKVPPLRRTLSPPEQSDLPIEQYGNPIQLNGADATYTTDEV